MWQLLKQLRWKDDGNIIYHLRQSQCVVEKIFLQDYMVPPPVDTISKTSDFTEPLSDSRRLESKCCFRQFFLLERRINIKSFLYSLLMKVKIGFFNLIGLFYFRIDLVKPSLIQFQISINNSQKSTILRRYKNMFLPFDDKSERHHVVR